MIYCDDLSISGAHVSEPISSIPIATANNTIQNNSSTKQSSEYQISCSPSFGTCFTWRSEEGVLIDRKAKTITELGGICSYVFGEDAIYNETMNFQGGQSIDASEEGILCNWRPFLGSNTAENGKETVASQYDNQLKLHRERDEESSSIRFSIPPRQSKELRIDVVPTEAFNSTQGSTSEKGTLFLNVTTSFYESISLVTVPIQWIVGTSIVNISPKSVDFGICHIGKSYSYKLTVHNQSSLPVVIKPYPSVNLKEFQIPTIFVNGHETKEFELLYTPIQAEKYFSTTIIFENKENSGNTNEIKFSSKVVDTKPGKIHELFYKIYEDGYYSQSNIQFRKGLYNVPSVTIIKLKNLWNRPLFFQIFSLPGISIRIVNVQHLVESTLSNREKKKKNFFAENSFSSALEDLKWGSNSANSEVAKLPPASATRLSLETKNKRMEDAIVISPNINALDVIPAKAIRSMSNTITVQNSESEKFKLRKDDSLHEDNFDPTSSNQCPIDLPNLISIWNETMLPWIYEENSLQDLICKLKNNNRLKEQPNFATHDESRVAISSVQECYKMLLSYAEFAARRLDSSVDVEELAILHEFWLEEGAATRLAIFWEPIFEQSEANDYGVNLVQALLQIRLPLVTPQELEESQRELDDPKIFDFLQGVNIVPRTVTLSCHCAKSEMIVIQKNINIGKVIAGEVTSKMVTIVNKSPTICLYSFSKSGSILSGFLNIKEGRKGILLPFSTRNIQIIFKPTLPCTFEETLTVQNILDVGDSHAVIVKAKVIKMEPFSISVVRETTDGAIPSNSSWMKHLPNNVTMTNIFSEMKHLLDLFVQDQRTNQSSELNSTTKFQSYITTAFKGIGVVGKSPTLSIKFKIKNPTKRKRQILIDGSGQDCIELLHISRYYTSFDNQNYEIDSSIKSLSQLQALLDCFGSQVTPLPNFLQSVLSVRYHFNCETISVDESKANSVEADVEKLTDELEKNQQKLKINLRKGKLDKISKYEKKIEELIQKLAVANNPTIILPSDDSELQQMSFADNAESLFNVILEPEEEKLITIKLGYLPGIHYYPWNCIQPFLGRLRIYEAKREDFVRTILFGSLLFSSPAVVDSDFSGNSLPVNINTTTARDCASEVTSDVPTTFLVNIPPWCSVTTRHINPKYKKLPVAMLGACIKISRIRREPVLIGCFYVAHMFDGKIEVSIEELNQLIPHEGNYKAYHSPLHGHLHVIEQSSFNHTFDSSSSTSNPNSEEFCHNLSIYPYEYFGSTGDTKIFQLLWTPPTSLLTSNSELTLHGTIKIRHHHSHGSELLSSLVVPFVCIHHSHSIIQIPKYFSMDSVSMGTYTVQQMTITNISETELLHYILTLEPLSEKYATRGQIDILSGKSGVIAPKSEKSVSILFSATSLGNFEQKLWCQNLNDSFDQKRAIIQATVIVTQATFVVLPDVIFSTHDNKYKMIDLGKIQIKQLLPSRFANIVGNISRIDVPNISYPLRVQNVSDKTLLITAIANLRNQCFIYFDEDCHIPVVDVVLKKSDCMTIYIVLRPNDIEKTKSTNNFVDPVSKRQLVRELIGGIRLVFLAQEQPTSFNLQLGDSKLADETGSSLVDFANYRKLFEIPLTFKAMVGKSQLSIGGFEDIIAIPASGSEIQRSYVGDLFLTNEFDHFPANYFIFDPQHHLVFAELDQMETINKNCGIQFVLFCSSSGILSDREERLIKFQIFADDKCYGFYNKSFFILNVCTNEVSEVCFTIYVASNKVSATFDNSVNDRVTINQNTFSLIELQPTYPIWIFPLGKEESISGFQIGYEEKFISWVVQNNLKSYLTLELFTDLPVYFTVEFLDELISGNVQSRKIICSKDSTQSIQTEEYLQSVNVGNQLNCLHKIGDAFYLKPLSSAIITLHLSMSIFHLNSNDLQKLLKGLSLGKDGIVCLVETCSNLQSMFAPPLFDENSPNTSLPEQDVSSFNDSPNLAVLNAFKVNYNIQSPVISISPTVVDIGSLRWNGSHEFSVQIMNSCTADIICYFECLPTWLTLTAKTCLAKADNINISEQSPYVGFLTNGGIQVTPQEHSKQLHFIVKAVSIMELEFLINNPGKTEKDILYELHLKTYPVHLAADFEVLLKTLYDNSSMQPLSRHILLIKIAVDQRSAITVDLVEASDGSSRSSADSNWFTNAFVSRFSLADYCCIPGKATFEVPQDSLDRFVPMVGVGKVSNISKLTNKFVVHNNLSFSIQLSLKFEIDSDLESLLSVKCKFENNKEDYAVLQPQDSTIVHLQVSPSIHGRLDNNFLDVVQQHLNVLGSGRELNDLVIESVDENFRKYANSVQLFVKETKFGPLRLGKLYIVPEISSLVINQEINFMNDVLTKNDIYNAEIVCHCCPKATLSLYLPMAGKFEINKSSWQALLVRLNMDDIGLKATNEQQCCFYLVNSSNVSIKFLSKSNSIRLPGIRFCFNNPTKVSVESVDIPIDSLVSDTIGVELEPPSGEIPPCTALLVKLTFTASSPSDAIVYTIEDCENHSALFGSSYFSGDESLLCSFPVYFWDEDWPVHPPLQLQVTLVTSAANCFKSN